ncbi:valine--tRNA ligase, mitochondrial 1-like [Brassica napus]|uniref:valine--tRNA ligase, mitochondrial 1-like n=1 Tax=Brassica napus TaxID=3708 RepID=UPI0020787D9B|nr:valine--tRNA ligase, mitochondrial 1-like [Brassica napus]
MCEILDEKKKKKDEKAREKELKKLKALEKAKKLEELKAKQEKGGTNASQKKKSHKRDNASEENPEDFVDPETPIGERKRLSSQMAKQYSPAAVEKSWYAWWEKSDLFKADAKSSKPPFAIVLPPPNVTGVLHIGHALTVAIEDTLIRWKRMSGYNALWVPGLDHAGIATQTVVEKKLALKKLTRQDLTREEFLNEVWKWKDENACTILTQLRRLGASLDWSRECFTMDEQTSKAVTETFVRLFEEGLIYRDIRLVHWDCHLKTAVSDDEVEYMDIKEKTLLNVPGYEKPVEFGLLTSFAYPLEGGLGEEVVVATTRVETMLGDTAIAIHPDDARYKHLHGKFAVHPFNGRRLPIICDGTLVDPDFGTGCVKITPAHDPNDCELGKRHNLEFINIFTDDGKINTNGGPDFTGMPRFAAREALVEALKKQGLYRGAENKEMRLGLCQRTSDVIEPVIKPQWYLNCSMMAKEALNVAESKKLEFIPKQYTAEWTRWLENIRDWCISRQLVWGHRIPAWYASLEEDERREVGAYNDHWIVARNEEEARKEAAEKFGGKNKFELRQDEDVLDTWFSSGIFPLSVLGWPDETDDFKAFYPTSLIETGHDILFFWVARMVMMGIKLSGGEVPFNKVYLHPMIRDAHGRKMSKSRGNVIDPIEVIEGATLDALHKRLEKGNLDKKELEMAKKGQENDFPDGISECGVDALRFALVSYTAQSEKINLDILRVVGYRQWCNKLWNAVRFALIRLGDGYAPTMVLSPETMPFSCQWILSELNKTISKTVESLDAFDLSEAANTVYAWWQYQFCDVFIEAIKPYFANAPLAASERAHAQDALWVSLETGLRLLHPFMPFVTEELWQRLPSPKDCERKASIMICDYPSPIENWTNEKVEKEMETVLATVKCLRALRAALLEKQKNERLPAFALCENNVTSEIVKSHELEIRTLANLSSLEVLLKGEHAAPAGSAVETVNENLKVYLKVDRAMNAEAEQEKIRNKIAELEKQKNKLQKMMSASGYQDKVPAHIKEDNATKLAKILQEFDFFDKESARLLAETGNQRMEEHNKRENTTSLYCPK